MPVAEKHGIVRTAKADKTHKMDVIAAWRIGKAARAGGYKSVKHDCGTTTLHLYGAQIGTLRPDGSIMLCDCKMPSHTVKKLINELLPPGVRIVGRRDEVPHIAEAKEKWYISVAAGGTTAKYPWTGAVTLYVDEQNRIRLKTHGYPEGIRYAKGV